MEIYCIVTYKDDTYSYSGISEHDRHYFTTTQKAENFAKSNGYVICTNPYNTNTDVTLEIITVN